MSTSGQSVPAIELAQLYFLALGCMSLRQQRHLRIREARVRACGAIHDPAFFLRLPEIRTPGQLEHALEQWEAEVASRRAHAHQPG